MEIDSDSSDSSQSAISKVWIKKMIKTKIKLKITKISNKN